MSFLSVLLALFIDRIVWDGTVHRRHQWYGRYVHKLTTSLMGDSILKSGFAAVVTVLPIVALVGWLQVSVLPSFGTLLEFAFASTVLLFCLGPRDLGRDVEAYINARANGNQTREEEYAGHLLQKSEDTEQMQQIADGIFLAGCQRLIGPLFWFVLFGAAGAIAYRLIQQLDSIPFEEPYSAPLRESTNTLRNIADWAPARITAAGFAVAGNFDAVAAAWKNFSQQEISDDQSEASVLLTETGRAALDQGAQQQTALVADSMALVWRNLTLWVVLIGLISLFGQL